MAGGSSIRGRGVKIIPCKKLRADKIIKAWIIVPALKTKNPNTQAKINIAAIIKRVSFIH
jgi:hypothetical protein